MRILLTGGTIDKVYLEADGKLWFKDSIIEEILKQGRCTAETTVEILMQKDSLDFTDADRQVVSDACRRAQEEQLIITHGTDTMTRTAADLASLELAKTIVLTGSMIPHRVGSSDALFNLGCAVAAVQLLPYGVYIAINGEVFEWDKVEKNRKLGRFERTGA
ncbi:asparaginase domain-containing protein [Solemya velum gill symbiont]|uniref:asparaginase domain-containing protein n=1 Tax=Solemya velum gill symbiont TaxID=2340 RepID=UPI0018A86865|nr:asparaginase domain-containing protein [Solemya velum gill symbiont]